MRAFGERLRAARDAGILEDTPAGRVRFNPAFRECDVLEAAMNRSEAPPWTPEDTTRARAVWAEYQRQHDVSGRLGQTVGIDPKNGRVWFGESATDIRRQQVAAGDSSPLFCLRVGHDYYVRKRRTHG